MGGSIFLLGKAHPVNDKGATVVVKNELTEEEAEKIRSAFAECLPDMKDRFVLEQALKPETLAKILLHCRLNAFKAHFGDLIERIERPAGRVAPLNRVGRPIVMKAWKRIKTKELKAELNKQLKLRKNIDAFLASRRVPDHEAARREEEVKLRKGVRKEA